MSRIQVGRVVMENLGETNGPGWQTRKDNPTNGSFLALTRREFLHRPAFRC